MDTIPVAPPPESTEETTLLPLTFLDMMWLPLPHVHRLLFYPNPVSRTHFLHTLIPAIKTSLSQSLQHYTPLAGRLILSPHISVLPEIRYAPGDTVPLVIAVSDSSERVFEHLVSDGVKSCSLFHPLVPSLPPAASTESPAAGFSLPLLALQVTLFPDVGICVGVTNHHVVGDARSIFGFMKSWAFFSSNPNPSTISDLPSQFLPVYDRRPITDRRGLGKIFWDSLKNIKIHETSLHLLPSIAGKVRATFTLTSDQIEMLKNRILARRPDIPHVSSFTVACAYVWHCLVRSRHEVGGVYSGDELFLCAADCRARLDPPLPGNYFGNCLTACFGKAEVGELIGEDGLAEAAAVIGDSVRRRLYSGEGDGLFEGAEDWFKMFAGMRPDRVFSLAGSPNFDYYGLDFGWGKGKKFEMPSIDITGAISIGASRIEEEEGGGGGGREFGVTLPVTHMDTFAKIFAQGLIFVRLNKLLE
ncbi:unnamed protein product [Cuscuta campestris]|uniref:Uncharacterized protein n=1 Tax=Cuscuta campestris TaxID=132261 RepID=A0A484K730_9ASTE|nr:unnamed protein product [Cuscuta campestris]